MKTRKELLAFYLRAIAQRLDPLPPNDVDDEDTRYNRIYVDSDGNVRMSAQKLMLKAVSGSGYRTLGWIVYHASGVPIRVDSE